MMVSSINYRKRYWVMRINIALSVMFVAFSLGSTLMINTAM
ncbi:hypothetical protein ABZM74_002237 [Weissella confusa]